MYADQEERDIKLFFFTDGIEVIQKNLKESTTRKLLKPQDITRWEGCKLIYRSQLLSQRSKDHVEFKVTNTIPFTLAAHKMILQINLTRYVQTLYEENYKMLDEITERITKLMILHVCETEDLILSQFHSSELDL